MESPSEPITGVEKAGQSPASTGGKSRRVRAAERAKTSIRSGSVTFKEHALPVITIDPASRTITLPAPLSKWEPVTSVQWRDVDMCVRYVIKLANGGGSTDLTRIAKLPAAGGGPAAGGPEPSKSDVDDTEDKPKA